MIYITPSILVELRSLNYSMIWWQSYNKMRLNYDHPTKKTQSAKNAYKIISVFLLSLEVNVLHNFLEFKAENIGRSQVRDKVCWFVND